MSSNRLGRDALRILRSIARVVDGGQDPEICDLLPRCVDNGLLFSLLYAASR
jgi:hypothetical protein